MMMVQQQHELLHVPDRQQTQFPVECTQHIFSYLQLKDCLRFATTSSASLREILPTIRIRRDGMTKTTYGVMVTYPKISKSLQSSSNTKYNVQIGAIDEMKNSNFHTLDYDKSNEHGIMFEFPTLPQRVAQLAIRMPCTHPMYTSVQQLNQAVATMNRRPHDNGSENDNEALTIQVGNCNTKFLIQMLQQYILPLKLHAKILYNTVLSNHCYDSNTTTLHNYIGDILCVTHLLYDFDCPTYAEHSINVQWLTRKLQLYSPTCYQSWVLIHASILRTKPFTPKQRIRLGFSSPSTVSSSNTGCFQYIDSMYEQLNVDGIVQTSKLLFGWWHAVGIIQIRTDQFVKSEMCIIYDEFGPLGHNNSFRGRDIVQVRDITADTMTEYLLLYPLTTATSTIAHTTLNSTIRESIEWICIVHEQAYKSRPMSVRIPMIRFN